MQIIKKTIPAMLISDEVHFRGKKIIESRDSHYIMIRRL